MRYIRLITALLFGLLHLYAGAVQYKSGENRNNAALLIVGGACTALGGICGFFARIYAAAAVLLGIAAVCLGAYLNGRARRDVHVLHHVLRAIVGAALAGIYWLEI